MTKEEPFVAEGEPYSAFKARYAEWVKESEVERLANLPIAIVEKSVPQKITSDLVKYFGHAWFVEIEGEPLEIRNQRVAEWNNCVEANNLYTCRRMTESAIELRMQYQAAEEIKKTGVRYTLCTFTGYSLPGEYKFKHFWPARLFMFFLAFLQFVTFSMAEIRLIDKLNNKHWVI